MPAPHEHPTLCVLVGAGEFDAQHPFPDLRGGKAGHSVAAMAEVLKSRQRPGRPVHVKGIVDPASPQQIRDALKPKAKPKAEPSGLLVFYYVGHGYRDPNNQERLYLAVRGSDAQNMSGTALAVEELIRLVNDFGAAESVVILDCCYSGDALNHKSTDLTRPFGTLTSSLAGRVISPGPDSDPLTPFTRMLVSTLRRGPHTLYELGRVLRGLSEVAENQPPGGYTWFPTEASLSGGANIVLPPEPVPERPVPVPVPEPGPEIGSGTGPGGWLSRLLGRFRSRRQARYQGRNTRRRTATQRGSRRVGWLSASLVGALVVSLLTVAAMAVVQDDTAACHPPLELRVVTAPEEVAGVRQLVRGFENSSDNERDTAGAEHCRAARFTVYGASLDALTRAFGDAGAWGHGAALAEVGPQPDVWVAQSSAAVSRVHSGLVPPDGVGREFLTDTTLMKDDPVLVLTEPARERLGLPEADRRAGSVSWRRLRDTLLAQEEDERPALYRPNPTVSGVGLVHTIGMYAKRGSGAFEGSLLPDDEIHRLETDLISKSRSLAGSEQALCALRDDEAAGALVGLRQAVLHERQPGYCSVGEGSAVRVHRYVLDGGPPLDYQLVEVAWPADDRAERAAALARLSDWVHGDGGEKHLRGALYAPSGGDLASLSDELADRDVTELLGSFHRAHPELRLTVLFDISGSMQESGRFEAAERAVEESLDRLAESDRYRVTLYPDGTDGAGTRRHVEEWTPVSEEGAALGLGRTSLHGPDDRYADLLGALQATSERIPEHDAQIRHAVLLVTDGDYVAGEEPRVDRLGRLAGDLGARGVPVIVASMRPYGCADDKDTGTIALRSGGQCEPLSGDLAATLSRHVAALTEGRVQ